jgi:hypothetical protein
MNKCFFFFHSQQTIVFSLYCHNIRRAKDDDNLLPLLLLIQSDVHGYDDGHINSELNSNHVHLLSTNDWCSIGELAFNTCNYLTSTNDGNIDFYREEVALHQQFNWLTRAICKGANCFRPAN